MTSTNRHNNPVVVGQRFGRLVTISVSGRSIDKHKLWLCKCDCGNDCVRQSNALKSSGIPSCGCAASHVQIKHGMRYSREYRSWQSAKQRCHSPDSKDYKKYGARGISMCDRWRFSFQAFFDDMGNRPPDMTLERKDTNGNYEPWNCEWATAITQSRNRRKSIRIEWHGKSTHLCEVATELGITYGAAFMRLKRGKLHASY